MNRREFVLTILALTAWPRAAVTQQSTPVIGFLSSASPAEYKIRVTAFHQGLKETGYIEGQNVTIEYRWAEGDNSRLRMLATELVNRQVAVLVAGGGTPAALIAKAATTTIPVVFAVAVDPVEAGLVPNLNKPGGNLTGISNLNLQMGPKKLEVVRELLPAATDVGVLVNPSSPTISDAFVRELQPAAKSMGMQLHVLYASKDDELEHAFSELSRRKLNALVVGPDVFFNTHTEKIAALSLRYAVPTVYNYRPFVAAGGLVTYGSDETEYYRLAGIYTGRILRGDKPGDLPVQQSTKVQLIINLKTAKTLGIAVPLSLLGRADEVID
jgi:putative tryptophan/tyrosine transport system substrate-binding protein